MRKFNSLAVVAAGTLTGVPVMAANTNPGYVVLDHSEMRAQLPFSDAVIAGNTLYVSGSIGLDPGSLAGGIKTARVPEDAATEARFVLDAVKHIVDGSGFRMDELVSVQVFCTDLTLFGTFNDVYRSYFHNHFPARAFIGVDKLVIPTAHFEVMATAVRSSRSRPATSP
jgi:2-iminobutanoate/2-iminopropanoate deaminase